LVLEIGEVFKIVFFGGVKVMHFRPIKYMDWFKTKTKVSVDLCSSGVKSLTRKDLNLPWEDLEISGNHFYGYLPLIQAIGERYGVSENSIVSTVGTSQAIFLVCAALLEPGDEVLVETPVYEPLLAVPEAFGARVVRLARRYEEGYQFSAEIVERFLSPKTKFILLTNLHNPSGALIPRELLEKVVQIARERDVTVVVDEIYLEFIDDEPTAFHLADNIVVISSLTKVFGLGDLRCGWVLAQPALAKTMRRIIDSIHVEGVFIGEVIAFRVFDRLDEIKRRNREWIRYNRTLVHDFINQEDSLSWIEPADGVVCFPKINNPLINGDRLTDLLRSKHDTAIVPGSFFEQSQHFRLGFGVDTESVAAGLENISKVLKEF
jgi:aspartate/methionine/tyrosine aminotransferase